MKRRATQALFALGLLLVFASAAALVRGSWVSDVFRISWVRPPRDGVQVVHDVEVLVNRQVCAAIWMRTERHLESMQTTPWHPRLTAERGTPQGPVPILRSAGGSLWDRLGFMRVWRGSTSPDVVQRERGAAVPSWFIALLGVIVALPPARALRRARRRRQRSAAGLCPACGYDLRGAAHERCPECGETVAPSVVAV